MDFLTIKGQGQVGILMTENNTLENSHQPHKQAIKEKKERTHEFNEVQQLPTSSEQKGREILLNNQLHDIIHGNNTPLYITRESLRKRKPTDLNSDQKRT